MRRRTFEEMITYFNQTVSEMDIDRKYKMTLLGIVTALLQKHDDELAKNSPKVNSDSGELISRQAAYDTLTEYYHHPTEIQHKALREALERVPTAQPELIRINLNEPIKVKLTDWGKEIYYHQYDRTNQIAGREICKPRFPREDENGYTEFQLWCFIELYGMHMGMTLPNVIEPLEIVYER